MATDPTRRSIPPRRDFALLDLLIFVAALAAAFALARPDLDAPLRDVPGAPLFGNGAVKFGGAGRLTWLGRAYARADIGLQVGSKVASMLMLGLLVVSLRPPRPGLRRLARRPGFVACVAAASAMAVNALEIGAEAIFRTVPISNTWNPFESVCRARIGPAVLGAWLLLWSGGRWRSERGSIDRSGRLLGLFWLAEAAWPPIDRYVIARLPVSLWSW